MLRLGGLIQRLEETVLPDDYGIDKKMKRADKWTRVYHHLSANLKETLDEVGLSSPRLIVWITMVGSASRQSHRHLLLHWGVREEAVDRWGSGCIVERNAARKS